MELYDINLWFTENQNKQFESIRYVLQVILLCVLQAKIFNLLTQSIYSATTVQMGYVFFF